MRLVTLEQLRDARESIGDKWCRGVDAALLAAGVGLRSPGERHARDLILTSRILIEPGWNVWVDLNDGEPPVCLDALWAAARLVHEVNGKRYHKWDLTFEDMQARHDRLTAAGLIALHNAPTRIRRDPSRVLSQIERTHARYDGLGLPEGVRIIDDPYQLRIA